ncbi:hypothetical protein NDU88_003961 [Pleurodeles waltl]|uniref:Uncharacterized protein n=1 Tax=Pleurodeles waltl TaxID=8319 RepID=A0AAV7RIY0_PLEWA|nr:hypothetical protein NDU88_003961 [Pleurodeles waltl]
MPVLTNALTRTGLQLLNKNKYVVPGLQIDIKLICEAAYGQWRASPGPLSNRCETSTDHHGPSHALRSSHQVRIS